MTEQSTESTRTFYRDTYAKLADITRRARHNASPSQVKAMDDMTQYLVTYFTADNPAFDPAGYIRASLRKVETTDNESYVAWALANEQDPNAPLANEDAFYAAGGTLWDVEVTDEPDVEEDGEE